MNVSSSYNIEDDSTIPRVSTPPGQGWVFVVPGSVLGHTIPHTWSGPYGQPVNTVNTMIKYGKLGGLRSIYQCQVGHQVDMQLGPARDW